MRTFYYKVRVYRDNPMEPERMKQMDYTVHQSPSDDFEADKRRAISNAKHYMVMDFPFVMGDSYDAEILEIAEV